jgi:hypothetical protein
MSTYSYTTGSDVMKTYSRVFQTTGLTPDDLESFVEDAEVEINGLLGGKYPVPFTKCSYPPLVGNLAKRLAAYKALRSQIIMDGQSRSDWVEIIRAELMEVVTGLNNGSLKLVSGSGTLIEPAADPSGTVWSSTMDYVPTYGMGSTILQEIDPSRVDTEDARREDFS